MDKISVLISGRDSFYNEMLAMALVRENRSISVSCAAPEMLLPDRGNRLAGFDVILAEKIPAGFDTGKYNIILLSERAENRGRSKGEILRIYKYQSVKSIASEILTASGIYGTENRDLYDEMLPEENRRIRLIGISGASATEMYSLFGRVLAEYLAFSGRKTVLLDMRDYKDKESLHEKTEGSRTWDDFIYCCAYGKTGDIFERPELYASLDESGLLLFSNRGKESNPFGALDAKEIRQFYSSVRYKLRSEYVVNILPENGSPGFYDNAGYQDIMILVNDRNSAEEKQSRFVRERLEGIRGFRGRTLNVCLGDRLSRMPESDFYVSLSGSAADMDFEELVSSQTWADVTKVAEYIDEHRVR